MIFVTRITRNIITAIKNRNHLVQSHPTFIQVIPPNLPENIIRNRTIALIRNFKVTLP